MKYRHVGFGAKIINCSIAQAALVLARESILHEFLAIKVNEYIIPFDDDHISYYSVINQNGIGLIGSSFIHVMLGPLTGTAADYLSGGKNKSRLVFIKLNNDERILISVEEDYYRTIRSKRKKKRNEIDRDDERWIEDAIDVS